MLLVISLMSLGLVSCASKKEVVKEERVFDKTYTVVESSSKVFPEWIGEQDKNDKDFRYFVSEAKNKNQRLCMKSAEVRATSKIASEISQFIKNSYGESVQGGRDQEVEEYMEESLASEAQAFVVGAQVSRTYFEKRKYDKKLGAEENYSEYYCFALIKMKKDNLEKAVNNALKKLYSTIENKEAKEKTQNALKDVAKKFNEI